MAAIDRIELNRVRTRYASNNLGLDAAAVHDPGSRQNMGQ